MRLMPLADKLKAETPGLPTAARERRLHYVSPSQLHSYRRCGRRWYGETVLQIKSPENPSQRLGSAVHAIIEEYLTTGDVSPTADPQHVAIAAAGQQFWPDKDQGDRYLVEQEILVPIGPDVLPLYGFADVVWFDGRVDDHKTTSDFKYAKSEYELRSDPQALTYGAYALSIGALGKNGNVKIRFLYYRTKGVRKAIAVETEMTPDDITSGIDQIRADVEKMTRHVSLQPFNEVAFNLDACKDYGGCHLRNRCHLTGVPVQGHTVFDDIVCDLAGGADFTRALQGVLPMSDHNEPPAALQGIFARRKAAAARIAQEEEAAERGPFLPPPVTTVPVAQLPAPPASINPPDGFPMHQPGTLAGPPAPSPRGGMTPLPIVKTEPTPAADAPVRKKLGRPPGRPAAPPVTAPQRMPKDVVQLPFPEPTPAAVPPQLVVLDGRQTETAAALDRARLDLRAANDKYADLLDVDDDQAEEHKVDVVLPARSRVKKAEEALATARVAFEQARDAEDAQRAAEAAKRAAEAAKRAAEAAQLQAEQEAVRAALAAQPTTAPAETISVGSFEIELPAMHETPPTGQRVVGEGEPFVPRIYIGCQPRAEPIIYFDDWAQNYYRRAEATRKTSYWLNMQHEAVPAVIAEMLADLRSGKVRLDRSMVFPRYTAQQSGFVDALIPFYGAQNVVDRVG